MNVFPAKFRFFFEKDNQRYECKYSPDEWNNNVLNWNRSSDSAGIMIKYSTNFTFIKEDADYLRDCFNTDGVFSEVRFVVEEYDYETFSFKPYYSGDIDFYSYENSKNKVSIVTSDISYKASIDANLDTTYEIDIPNASDFVRYDRLMILSNSSFYSFYEDNTLSGAKQRTDVFSSMIMNKEDFDPKNIFHDVDQGTMSNDNWIAMFNDQSNITCNVKYKINKITFSWTGNLDGFSANCLYI